jgi:hypothetical protein
VLLFTRLDAALAAPAPTAALSLPVGALQPEILRILGYPDLERVANPTNTLAQPIFTASFGILGPW